MIERLVTVFAVSVISFVIYSMLRDSQMSVASSAASKLNNDSGKDSGLKNIEIIYFWSNQCQQCKSVQGPVLERLVGDIGHEKVSVTKYDVSSAPEEAKKWGIKTVPTVILLDKNGQVKTIYNGAVSAAKLRKEINSIS